MAILRSLRILSVVSGTILAALLIHVVTANAPFIVYELRRPSIAHECSMIRPGMSRDEAVRIFERTPPRQEGINGGRITIVREDGSCIVELNSPDNTVARAWLDSENRVLGPADF